MTEKFLSGLNVEGVSEFHENVQLFADLLDKNGDSATTLSRYLAPDPNGGVVWSPPLLTPLADWASGTAYTVGDLVLDADRVYKALVASPTGQPSLTPAEWADLGRFLEYLGAPAGALDLVPAAVAGNQGQILTSDGTKWNPQNPPLLKVFSANTAPTAATANQNVGDLCLVTEPNDPDYGHMYVYEGSNVWKDLGTIRGPMGPAISIQGEVELDDANPPATPKEGDAYILIAGAAVQTPAAWMPQFTDASGTVRDAEFGDLLFWDGVAWVNGGHIVGPQGDKGDQGDRGASIFHGAGDPNVNVPTLPPGGFVVGDLYWDANDDATPVWWWDNNQWNHLTNDFTGPSGTASVGTVTTGAAGSAAAVANSGTPSAAVFDFTIPKGDKGDQGDQAQFSTPTATGLAAGATPTAAISGTGAAGTPYILALGIPKGDKGDQGDQPQFGTPTVSAVAAGGTPTVGISGAGTPASPYTLALGLVTGDTGPQGPQPELDVPTVTSVPVGANNTPGTPTVAMSGTGSSTSPYHLSLGIPVGATGPTPQLTIGTVTGVAPTGATTHGNPSASFGGTADAPVLNLGIPQGLKGDQGDTGNSLEAAWGTTTPSELTITVKDHTGATVGTPVTQDLIGPQGIQGIQGIQGPVGTGIAVLPPVADAPARNALTPAEGNLVLQLDTGEMYAFTGGVWVLAGQLVGPQGVQGPQGIQGIQGLQGIQGPVPLFGTHQVTAINAGGAPTVSASGTGATGDPIILTFGLVTGDTGATGPQGPQGDIGNSLSHVWEDGAGNAGGTFLRIDTTDAAGTVTQGTPVDLVGPQGPAGNDGVGLPEDPLNPGTPIWGTAGQLLATNAGANGAEWIDPPEEIPALGTAGQVLTVNAGATDFEWADVDALPAGGNADDFLQLTATGAAWVAPVWDPAGTAAAAQTAAEATAAAALTAHEAAANPHPDYLTQTEGDARYPQFVLDTNGHVPSANLPPLVITDVHTVADQAAMLALTGVHRGDVAIIPSGANRGSYILSSDTPSNAADWHLLGGPSDVTSVNGQTGTVVLAATNIGSVAAGNIAATNVADAINELDTDKVAKAGDTMSGHLTFGVANQIRITGAAVPTAGQVLTATATGMAWAAAGVGKFAGDVTLTANTWATVTHSLGTTDVVVSVRAGLAVVDVEAEVVDADNIRVRGTVAGVHRVVVIG